MKVNMDVVVLGSIPSILYLVAWTVAVVFVVRMVRSGGGRPERFLLIGVSLMLFSSLINASAAVIMPNLPHWLAGRGMSVLNIAAVFSGIAIFRGLIGLTGIIYLIYAFWLKFKKGCAAEH